MTSFQAELGADEGIAEELAKGQREISIAEFFEKNKHMLGFDSGARRFHAREQNRGQQGIGISAAVLYSQLTSGKPAKITSRTQESDQAEYFELIIDTDTNEPEIRDSETTTWDRTHGTRIELEMEANMRARQQLHQYIKNTAVVNPHARITRDADQDGRRDRILLCLRVFTGRVHPGWEENRRQGAR